MKRTIVLLVVLLLIAGCGADDGGAPADGSGGEDASTNSPAATVRIEASGGENVEVQVEIADDTEEMARGLMGRTALAEDAGMLFVYPEERELSFWMKDTLIPLSIAFMDREGRIVDIQDMKALDDTPPHYASAEPAQYALEVNKGFFDERGVEVGDEARLPT
jgi:uncharacterized membrane protein (UPF0127 family)